MLTFYCILDLHTVSKIIVFRYNCNIKFTILAFRSTIILSQASPEIDGYLLQLIFEIGPINIFLLLLWLFLLWISGIGKIKALKGNYYCAKTFFVFIPSNIWVKISLKRLLEFTKTIETRNFLQSAVRSHLILKFIMTKYIKRFLGSFT